MEFLIAIVGVAVFPVVIGWLLLSVERLTVAIYDPQMDLMQDERVIEVVVAVTVRGDADISEVISEMDYQFKHEMILDTEIRDVLTDI